MKNWQGSILIYGANAKNRQSLLTKIIEEILGKNPKEGPNLIFIKGEESIGIDQIRYLESQIALKPQESAVKVAVLKASQNLTAEAQNALLKTLEEPPESTTIILEANQKEALPETLISRCKHFFATDIIDYNPSREDQKEILAENEKILSGGLDDKFLLALKISQEALIWLEKELYFWRDLALLKLGCGDLVIHQEIKEGLLSLARKIGKKEIFDYLEKLVKTRKLIVQNIGKRLALEVLFLSAPRLE
jgi:DNA polymerase III gamma/tau subunit